MAWLENYKVTVAGREDTEELLSLLKDVAHNLKGKGSSQWETLLNGEDDQEIIEAVERKQAYIIKEGNVIIATFTIYPQASDWDNMLWKDSGEAVYLHKLAVSPNEAGRGLGKRILGWLEKDLRDNGIQRIRLDCIEDNDKLNMFYANSGYVKVGSRHGFSLFEKIL